MGTTGPSTPRRLAALLIFGSVFFALLGAEGAARIRVKTVWSPEHTAGVLGPPAPKYGFVYAPETGYRLEPDYHRQDKSARVFRHNSIGLRGDEIGSKDPNVVRVVVLGASTVYGIYVDGDSTSSAVLERTLNLNPSLPEFEVINAGVPGWTSRETRINFERQIAALEPDVVVVVDGRNEVFPQLFSSFAADYSHYRKIPWDYASENAKWKQFFRVSHLAMVLMGDVQRPFFGYSVMNEDPVYGSIRIENQPDFDHIETAASNPAAFEGWRTNLRAITSATVAMGAVPVLVEMPFRSEAYDSGVLPVNGFGGQPPERVQELVGRVVSTNNEITAEIAAEFSALFVRTGSVVHEELMLDDCHFNERGEAEFGKLLARAIEDVWTAEDPARATHDR